ncbi:MAG: IS110 family transposase [Bacteroidota bacterium]
MRENNRTKSEKKLMGKRNSGKHSNVGAVAGRVSREVQSLLFKLACCRNRPGGSGDTPEGWTIGIDLGDKWSRYCFLDTEAAIVAEGSLATVSAEIKEYFSCLPKSRIALEAGTHSAWVSAQLESYGHEVYVANPRKMESIHKNRRKNDKVDTRTLARLVRADPALLYPIQHRGLQARQDLVLLRARDNLVAVRTDLINCVRGLVKSVGARVPMCSADSFHKTAREAVPEGVRDALLPVIQQIESLTESIHGYDRVVSRMAEKKYPETGLLQQVKGVGDLTSLAFVLTLEKPERFQKSRDVGAYLGLVPRQDDSGESSPQLRITKTGDRMLRRLLVSSAHYILGPFGEDCDLRRFGQKMSARGGKNAKRRAVVAVARRLGILLHRLWVTAEVYDPLRNTRIAEQASGAAAIA